MCIEFEFEPQTFSGQVKFIGNVDSEYVDHRIYAGIKLDEPGVFISLSFKAVFKFHVSLRRDSKKSRMFS
jgi:hypothetical protein